MMNFLHFGDDTLSPIARARETATRREFNRRRVEKTAKISEKTTRDQLIWSAENYKTTKRINNLSNDFFGEDPALLRRSKPNISHTHRDDSVIMTLANQVSALSQERNAQTSGIKDFFDSFSRDNKLTGISMSDRLESSVRDLGKTIDMKSKVQPTIDFDRTFKSRLGDLSPIQEFVQRNMNLQATVDMIAKDVSGLKGVMGQQVMLSDTMSDHFRNQEDFLAKQVRQMGEAQDLRNNENKRERFMNRRFLEALTDMTSGVSAKGFGGKSGGGSGGGGDSDIWGWLGGIGAIAAGIWGASKLLPKVVKGGGIVGTAYAAYDFLSKPFKVYNEKKELTDMHGDKYARTWYLLTPGYEINRKHYEILPDGTAVFEKTPPGFSDQFLRNFTLETGINTINKATGEHNDYKTLKKEQDANKRLSNQLAQASRYSPQSDKFIRLAKQRDAGIKQERIDRQLREAATYDPISGIKIRGSINPLYQSLVDNYYSLAHMAQTPKEKQEWIYQAEMMEDKLYAQTTHLRPPELYRHTPTFQRGGLARQKHGTQHPPVPWQTGFTDAYSDLKSFTGEMFNFFSPEGRALGGLPRISAPDAHFQDILAKRGRWRVKGQETQQHWFQELLLDVKDIKNWIFGEDKPKHAGGGTVAVKGRPGTDTNLVSVNNQPVAYGNTGEDLIFIPRERGRAVAYLQQALMERMQRSGRGGSIRVTRPGFADGGKVSLFGNLMSGLTQAVEERKPKPVAPKPTESKGLFGSLMSGLAGAVEEQKPKPTESKGLFSSLMGGLAGAVEKEIKVGSALDIREYQKYFGGSAGRSKQSIVRASGKPYKQTPPPIPRLNPYKGYDKPRIPFDWRASPLGVLDPENLGRSLQTGGHGLIKGGIGAAKLAYKSPSIFPGVLNAISDEAANVKQFLQAGPFDPVNLILRANRVPIKVDSSVYDPRWLFGNAFGIATFPARIAHNKLKGKFGKKSLIPKRKPTQYDRDWTELRSLRDEFSRGNSLFGKKQPKYGSEERRLKSARLNELEQKLFPMTAQEKSAMFKKKMVPGSEVTARFGSIKFKLGDKPQDKFFETVLNTAFAHREDGEPHAFGLGFVKNADGTVSPNMASSHGFIIDKLAAEGLADVKIKQSDIDKFSRFMHDMLPHYVDKFNDFTSGLRKPKPSVNLGHYQLFKSGGSISFGGRLPKFQQGGSFPFYRGGSTVAGGKVHFGPRGEIIRQNVNSIDNPITMDDPSFKIPKAGKVSTPSKAINSRFLRWAASGQTKEFGGFGSQESVIPTDAKGPWNFPHKITMRSRIGQFMHKLPKTKFAKGIKFLDIGSTLGKDMVNYFSLKNALKDPMIALQYKHYMSWKQHGTNSPYYLNPGLIDKEIKALEQKLVRNRNRQSRQASGRIGLRDQFRGESNNFQSAIRTFSGMPKSTEPMSDFSLVAGNNRYQSHATNEFEPIPPQGPIDPKSVYRDMNFDGGLSGYFKTHRKVDIKSIEPATKMVMRKARMLFGKDIGINSGYRSRAYNDSLPRTAKNSQHIHKRAIDASTMGMNQQEKRDLLISFLGAGFSSFGFYNDFLHADTRARGTTWGRQPGWARGVMSELWSPGMKPFHGLNRKDLEEYKKPATAKKPMRVSEDESEPASTVTGITTETSSKLGLNASSTPVNHGVNAVETKYNMTNPPAPPATPNQNIYVVGSNQKQSTPQGLGVHNIESVISTNQKMTALMTEGVDEILN